MKYQDLSDRERWAAITAGVRAGYTSLDEIEAVYNKLAEEEENSNNHKFGDGGDTEEPSDSSAASILSNNPDIQKWDKSTTVKFQKATGLVPNGIINPATKAMYKKVKNIVYSVPKYSTDALIRQSVKPIGGGAHFQNAYVPRNIYNCSQYVRTYYDAATNNGAEKAGFYADAWQLPKKIERHGGEMLYNAYDSVGVKEARNAKDLVNRSNKFFSNKKHQIDPRILQVGDVVGMYMPSSNMHDVAFKNGTTHNTHVGLVTNIDKKGNPIISHNVHGNYKHEKVDRLTGSLWGRPQISVAVRPDKSTYNKYIGEFDDNAKSDYELIDNSGQIINEPRFNDYMDGLASAKRTLSKVYKNVNVDDIEKIAIGIMKHGSFI